MFAASCLSARFNFSRRTDLNVSVGIPPQEGKPGEPVLGIDCLADAGTFFGSHDSRCRGKFRAGNFAAHGAGRDLYPRVVADALDLSQFTVGHEVNLVVILGKPDGRVYGYASFAEGRETDVMLAVDFGGDRRHAKTL